MNYINTIKNYIKFKRIIKEMNRTELYKPLLPLINIFKYRTKSIELSRGLNYLYLYPNKHLNYDNALRYILYQTYYLLLPYYVYVPEVKKSITELESIIYNEIATSSLWFSGLYDVRDFKIADKFNKKFTLESEFKRGQICTSLYNTERLKRLVVYSIISSQSPKFNSLDEYCIYTNNQLDKMCDYENIKYNFIYNGEKIEDICLLKDNEYTEDLYTLMEEKMKHFVRYSSLYDEVINQKTIIKEEDNCLIYLLEREDK